MYGYVQPNSKQVTSATNGDGQNYFNINSNATNTCESPHPVRLLILKRYLYFKNDLKVVPISNRITFLIAISH